MAIIHTPRWMEIIVFLKMYNANISDVGRATGMTYSHVFKLIKLMDEKGWVSVRKTGRENHVGLTAKGLRMAKGLYIAFKEAGLIEEDEQSR